MASNDSIFKGKYVTQMCMVSAGTYCVSIWNQSGVFIVSRDSKSKPIKIEDPRYNSHITDLKPLFPDQLDHLPYLLERNKNSINLIDLANRSVQPLIDIRNADLFCEKLCLRHVPSERGGGMSMVYVSWQNEKTFIKEIELPESFI